MYAPHVYTRRTWFELLNVNCYATRGKILRNKMYCTRRRYTDPYFCSKKIIDKLHDGSFCRLQLLLMVVYSLQAYRLLLVKLFVAKSSGLNVKKKNIFVFFSSHFSTRFFFSYRLFTSFFWSDSG